MRKPDAVLIAGPTASGKTDLAVRVATAIGGAVVNADSMQVYGDLRILTARPDREQMRGIEHHLFGHVAADDPYSVARWLEDVRALLPDLRERDLVPVFAGGTGLYFKALSEGLSRIPPIDPEIREKLRAIAREDPAGVSRMLVERDPAGAARIRAGDLQRLVRALEVVMSTGRPLAEWQAHGNAIAPPIEADAAIARLVLAPPREILTTRIARRFESMFEEGAAEEVRQVLGLGIAQDLPVMRAIGVRPIAAALAGNMPMEEAVARAIVETRQYAKRQMTWFRNQFGPEWHWFADPADIDMRLFTTA